jgi:hypothetical protein
MTGRGFQDKLSTAVKYNVQEVPAKLVGNAAAKLWSLVGPMLLAVGAWMYIGT